MVGISGSCACWGRVPGVECSGRVRLDGVCLRGSVGAVLALGPTSTSIGGSWLPGTFCPPPPRSTCPEPWNPVDSGAGNVASGLRGVMDKARCVCAGTKSCPTLSEYWYSSRRSRRVPVPLHAAPLGKWQ